YLIAYLFLFPRVFLLNNRQFYLFYFLQLLSCFSFLSYSLLINLLLIYCYLFIVSFVSFLTFYTIYYTKFGIGSKVICIILLNICYCYNVFHCSFSFYCLQFIIIIYIIYYIIYFN